MDVSGQVFLSSICIYIYIVWTGVGDSHFFNYFYVILFFSNKRMSACCWNKRPHLARLGLPRLRAQAEPTPPAGRECTCEVAVVVERGGGGLQAHPGASLYSWVRECLGQEGPLCGGATPGSAAVTSGLMRRRHWR